MVPFKGVTGDTYIHTYIYIYGVLPPLSNSGIINIICCI